MTILFDGKNLFQLCLEVRRKKLAEEKRSLWLQLVMSRYRNFATIRYHDIANIHGAIHHDTPRYRQSMEQQIIWYHRQCVCVQELTRKISSQCVLMLKLVRLTLDKY